MTTHRHSGPKVQYRTKRGNIRFRNRPLHVQTLIFPKNKYTRKKALNWAKDHGFKHYTSREEDNTIRVRQFPPSDVTRYGGTFPMGDDIQGLYAGKRTRRTIRRFDPREQERHLDSIFRLQEEIKPLQQDLRETAEEFNDISVGYWEYQLKGISDADNPFSDEHLSLSEERVALENKIFAKQETINEEKTFLE